MTSSDILIIGAGAAGLMAARELLRTGKKVSILEARNRIGGRIHTIYHPLYPRPVETGAEFIHGKLPITLSLLKEYGLHKIPLKGKLWNEEQGNFIPTPEYIPGAEVLEKALSELDRDMSVKEFLDNYLGDASHRNLYENIQRFVEGYDAADINRASACAFKKEWFDSSPYEQFRPSNGYMPLMEKMAKECENLGCDIHLNTIVKEIRWSPHHVEIITSEGIKYNSRQVLVTVPLGVLQSAPTAISHITFNPPINEKITAAKCLGYGSVVKIILCFRDAFWNHTEHKQIKNQLGFLFTVKPFSAWWTYDTGDVPMLCGWIGGPKAEALSHTKDSLILDLAISTLSQIFEKNHRLIHYMVTHHYISRWSTDPFTLGAYSYAVVNGEHHKKILTEPEEETLFFAGEALDEGGTVEAALASGKSVASRMG